MRGFGVLVNILFLTPDLNDNSLGRTYCLWMMAKALNWGAKVASFKGSETWPPIRGTEFESDCSLIDDDDFVNEANSYDLLVVIKPLPGSFGKMLKFESQLKVPILLDIDDPDLEVWQRVVLSPRILAKSVLRRRTYKEMVQLKSRVPEFERIVSNPYLSSLYGGEIIPHARMDEGMGASHISRSPVIAFVGTPRRHKGINALRRAVSQLQDLQYRLIVTAPPPEDAKPWEEWVGVTSLVDGKRLVSECDIVALPSHNTLHAKGQLPAKLVDAMLLGRAVVVSDIEPMPWAVGNDFSPIKPGNVEELSKKLRILADPSFRSALGLKLRNRALNEFTVEGVKERFRDICVNLIERG